MSPLGPKTVDPSQEEIAVMTAEIRKGWTPQQKESRSGNHLRNFTPYTIPEVHAHVGIGEFS